MPGNTFGHSFRITTAGESHGPGNVVIVDGVPSGIPLSVDDLRIDLRRRRPGQSPLVTQRQEDDEPEILSGVFAGQTLNATADASGRWRVSLAPLPACAPQARTYSAYCALKRA